MKLVDRGLSRDQRCTRYEGTPLSREKLGRQSDQNRLLMRRQTIPVPPGPDFSYLLGMGMLSLSKENKETPTPPLQV